MKGLEEKLNRAKLKVGKYLAIYGVKLPSVRIVLDSELEEGILATHRYPNIVVVMGNSVPESVIAHELVHIAQRTLESFRGFKLLYTMLAEGLADFVAKHLYPEHEVKYKVPYRLIELLVQVDEKVIGDILCINEILLTLDDIEIILSHPYVADYSRNLLGNIADRIRESIHTANRLGITDPTFVPLGEELRAWKFLLNGKFEKIKEKIKEMVEKWLEDELKEAI